MHRTNTLDYLFVINGEVELALNSGEKRVLKAGDTVVQRGPMHAWRNLSKTEPARMAAVAFGVEGAVKDEIIVEGQK
jgi:quercetin dioxygenase-like cupin family protein